MEISDNDMNSARIQTLTNMLLRTTEDLAQATAANSTLSKRVTELEASKDASKKEN